MEYDLNKLKPDIRKLNDMRQVFFDQDYALNSPDAELYFMYRGIEKKNGLRYDVTVLIPKTIGSEFNKTKGHYHLGSYQEVYTVLEGKAIYLMQKQDEKGNILDVYAVFAEKGDSVIIPPYYGHITINPSEDKELKMANWISEDCQSDYSVFEKMQGACYYYTKQGWIKNEKYQTVPELRFEQPLKSVPEDLNFLRKK